MFTIVVNGQLYSDGFRAQNVGIWVFLFNFLLQVWSAKKTLGWTEYIELPFPQTTWSWCILKACE